MRSKKGQREGFTMELSCAHAAIHIVSDVATCTDCGQTLGRIDRQHEQSGVEVLTIKRETRTWCLLSH
jgi:hypothetical protein